MRLEDDVLIDKASAKVFDPIPHVHKVPRLPIVKIKVVETHDGEECFCFGDDKIKELTVGQTLELKHICHDGREDLITATVIEIDGVVPEHHGETSVR